MTRVLNIEQLRFAWPAQPTLIDIPTLQLHAGEHLFIQGDSGSGKSTLLNLLTGMLPGFSGQIEIAGQTLHTLSRRQTDRLRADQLGILFQQFNLLPYLNLIENVCLPCRFSTTRRTTACRRSESPQREAIRLLERLGLDAGKLLQRPVAELSIGQQQRVAAARALIGAPALIIADEPTSALDPRHRDLFIDLLLEEAEHCGSTLLMVSHDPALTTYFKRRLQLGGDA